MTNKFSTVFSTVDTKLIMIPISSLTVQQGEQQNLNASDFLKKADSNSFFKVTNNLITTGATGTNVMDLVIGIYHQK